MVATMSDVSFASAIVNEIPGFDVDTAYAAIRKDAFEIPPPTSPGGRFCLASYLSFGYVSPTSLSSAPAWNGGPQYCYEVVSQVLFSLLCISCFIVGLCRSPRRAAHHLSLLLCSSCRSASFSSSLCLLAYLSILLLLRLRFRASACVVARPSFLAVVIGR